MKTWFETSACKSRAFCRSCRMDAAWRETVLALGQVTERDFACPPPPVALGLPLNEEPPSERAKQPPPPKGAGTILHETLARFGIEESPTCRCLAKMREMDREGPDWCEAHLEEIAAVMVEEAQKRNWLRFFPGKAFAARELILSAIAQARNVNT